MGCDEAADGGGGVAQQGSRLLHGNPSRGFELNSRFHAGMIAQEKRECRKFLQKNAGGMSFADK